MPEFYGVLSAPLAELLEAHRAVMVGARGDGLGVAGVIGLVVLGANFPVIIKAYQHAEQRRIAARNL